jgi:hypothetical protein
MVGAFGLLTGAEHGALAGHAQVDADGLAADGVEQQLLADAVEPLEDLTLEHVGGEVGLRRGWGDDVGAADDDAGDLAADEVGQQ